MRRPATKILVAAVAAGLAVIGLASWRRSLRHDARGGTSNADVPCGEGFFRRGARCCPTSEPLEQLGAGLCSVLPVSACPAPLVVTERGCDGPQRSVVRVPAISVLVGPSDWEAEGRVRPRTVNAGPFEIDRFEVTVGQARCAACPAGVISRLRGHDVARAASLVTREEARQICAARGGRLPTEDEWIVAAAGDKPHRYPWGDTGAVCRRAAWGLARGPCGNGATGPDTVGTHPDGASPLGIHDLAGNVAEWVESDVPCAGDGAAACLGVVRGGSYETDLATELRTWVRRQVPASATEASIGFRCAYGAPPP